MPHVDHVQAPDRQPGCNHCRVSAMTQGITERNRPATPTLFARDMTASRQEPTERWPSSVKLCTRLPVSSLVPGTDAGGPAAAIVPRPRPPSSAKLHGLAEEKSSQRITCW